MNYRTTLLTALGVAAFVATPSLAANSHDQMDHSKMDHSEMDMAGMCDMPMGEGVINSLDVKKSTVNLTHKPIEAIGWPEMSMDFTVLKPVDLSAFGESENVHFLLKQEKDKSYAITAMCSLDVDDGAHEACMAQMSKVAMTAAAAKEASCAVDDMSKMDHSGHH